MLLHLLVWRLKSYQRFYRTPIREPFTLTTKIQQPGKQGVLFLSADDRSTLCSKRSQDAAYLSGYFAGGQYSQVPQTLLRAEWLSYEQVCVTHSAWLVRSKRSQATEDFVTCSL